MTGRQYENVVCYGIRLGDVLESEIALKVLVVNGIFGHAAVKEKRLEFR